MEIRSKLARELLQYSKAELIDAFTRLELMDEPRITRVLRYLHQQRLDANFAKQEKALSAWADAQKNYECWLKAMAEKYGDGKTFGFNRLTIDELHQGIRLEKTAKRLYDAEKKCAEELDELLNKR